MERTERMCEEVHAYGGSAERTGTVLELRAMKAQRRTCTSVRDLVRKYKVYGDGMFYLPVGQWPENVTQLALDEKWSGITGEMGQPARTEE